MKNFLFFFKTIRQTVAKTVFPLSFFILVTILPAQPTIQWQKALGGSEAEESSCAQQTSDGGYVVVGFSASNDGDVSGWHGNIDFWVVKLNSGGETQWQKMLGGTQAEVAYSVQQTNDGGYIVAGYTTSNDGDVSGHHGDKDFWVVKLSSFGEIEWQKALGGSKVEEARSVRQTSDGGYIVCGWSFSTDGDVTVNYGYLDVWVVKLDESGGIQWQKSYGGATGADQAYSIKQTSDDGYILAGRTSSSDGDVSGYHGSEDFWVVKLSNLGEIEWQRALGGNGIDTADSIQETTDGGYIVAGLMSSNNGDITMHHGLFDYWVVKLSKTGDIEWQKSLGGSDSDWGRSVWQTSDGGYVVSGETSSLDGDITLNDGGIDCWVVKLTESGEIQWQKTFGGTNRETCRFINQTSDGGYVVTGYTQSNDGDVSGFHGGFVDFWVVKLSPESSSTTSLQVLPLEIYPNPATSTISIQIPTSPAVVFLSAKVLTEEETGAGKESTLTVSISDILGQEVSHQAIWNGGEVNLAAIPNGFYLLTATTPSGKVFSGKFRKQE